MNRYLVALILLFFSRPVSAQLLPADGSDLNYRLVGFSFPEKKGVKKYVVEIAEGDLANVDSFKKHLINSVVTAETSLFVLLPEFGKKYTWATRPLGKNNKDLVLHHFSVQKKERVDTTAYRLRILKHTNAYKDMYVVPDGGGQFYDLNGAPVAFLPEVNGLGGFVADLEFTPEGTMTHNFTRLVFEINLNGDILWQSPDLNPVNGGKFPDKYHHGVAKLSNGHYMTMGTEWIPSKVVVSADTSYVVLNREAAKQGPENIPEGYKLGVYGTLIEFDKDGNVVWSWKDSEHLVGGDFDYFNYSIDSGHRFDPHCNSFFVDEKNDIVYLSYRNLNRIIKIDRKTKAIKAIYGEAFKPGVKSYGSGIFCNQHAVRLSKEGYMYFFNNNSCRNTDSLPTIFMLKEPTPGDDKLSVAWKYNCTMEGDYPKTFGSGGCALELPDGAMFISMGNAYDKLSIVSREKVEWWSAIPERFVYTDNIWVPVKQYRANVISRKDLERMIWVAEKAHAKKMSKK